MATHTLSRSLHDVGLASWFGGSLMGAVGLNAAAGAVDDPRQVGRVANVGWNRWTPVNALAIGAHLAGSLGQLGTDAGRLGGQPAARRTAATKTALTVVALAATAYSRALGRRLAAAGDVPATDGTGPTAQTPPDLAAAQRSLRRMQWVVPAATGALVLVSARAGEQQRATEAVPLLRRLGRRS